MWSPIVLMRPDRCPKCRRENSVEIFDYFGRPLGYRNIINSYMAGRPAPNLDDRSILQMRCLHCNSVLTIRWKDGYPLPDWLIGRGLFQQFIDLYERGL